MTLREVVGKAGDFDNSIEADKIKLFGWYLHVVKVQKRFSTAQLRECYDEVHEKDPVSFSPYFKSLEGRKELLKDRTGYYLERRVIDEFTRRFGDEPVSQHVSSMLAVLPSKVTNFAERSFIEESLTCIRAGASRAAIVLGWCAIVDRMRRKIEHVGFDKFNHASTALKNQTSGKFKSWTKGVQANSMADLLAIFDTDLMIVLEGMGLLDDNQSQRLKVLFQWRCHSAHPADAPIKSTHVVTFFSDAIDLILASPKFEIPDAEPVRA